MATVFVWYPGNGNVGHASMHLETGAYVSWWPSGGVTLKQRSTVDATAPGIAKDKQAEGKIPDYASPPIKGLDETEMTIYWTKLSGRLPKEPHSVAQTTRKIPKGGYDLFEKSCSGIVLDVLKKGGMFKEYPYTYAMVQNNLVVSPLFIKELAEAMTGDFGNKIVNFMINSDLATGTLRRLWQYTK